MAKYLLDTNICISLIKNQYGLRSKIERIGERYCAVSEITMVTSNTKHFERIPGIKIEDWCCNNGFSILLNEPEMEYHTSSK